MGEASGARERGPHPKLEDVVEMFNGLKVSNEPGIAPELRAQPKRLPALVRDTYRPGLVNSYRPGQIDSYRPPPRGTDSYRPNGRQRERHAGEDGSNKEHLVPPEADLVGDCMECRAGQDRLPVAEADTSTGTDLETTNAGP